MRSWKETIVCLVGMAIVMYAAYWIDRTTPVKQVIYLNGNEYRLITIKQEPTP